MAGLCAVATSKIFKLAQSVRTNHVALVAGDQVAVGAFADEHVEVVEPEIGHHFLQLAVAVDGAQQFAFDQFFGDHLLRIVDRLDGFALPRRSCLPETRRACRPCSELVRMRCSSGDILRKRFHALIGRQVEEIFDFQVGVTRALAGGGRRSSSASCRVVRESGFLFAFLLCSDSAQAAPHRRRA